MTAAEGLSQKALSFAVAAGLLASSWLIQDTLHQASVEGTAMVAPPPSYIGLSIDPRIVRRLLGVRLLAADLIWADTIIKADMLHEKESYTPLYRAFRTITQLDPDNFMVYYNGGMYLSVIKDDIKGATALLREGVLRLKTQPAIWATAWQLPFALGYNLIFEEHDFEEGGRWIQEAAKSPLAPPLVRTLAEHVSTEAGRLEIASRLLNDMYRHAPHGPERQRIEAKMLDVAARQDLLDLNERFQQFLTSTQAYAFPKKRQLQAFLRSTNHPDRDLMGRKLKINDLGKIVPAE